MADLKREQELAERRKNDPQPDLAQDHLVRKIFSKFRKPSDGVPSFGAPSRPGSSAPNTADVEKGLGESKPKPAASEPESRVGSGNKMSKWAAALGGSTTAAPKTTTATDDQLYIDKQTSDREDQNLGAVRRTELVCKKSDHIQVVKDIRPPTQGNKWPRVATGGSVRPETIEEASEDGLEKKREPASVTTDSAAILAAAAARQPPPSTTDANKLMIQPKSINSIDYQQIVATLIDMRVDLKLEIQKLTNKMNTMDDHISNITRKLATINISLEDSASSAVPAITSAAYTSASTRIHSSAQHKPTQPKLSSVIGPGGIIEEVDEENVSTPTTTIAPRRLDVFERAAPSKSPASLESSTGALSSSLSPSPKTVVLPTAQPSTSGRTSSSSAHRGASSSHRDASSSSYHSKSSNLYQSRRQSKSKSELNGEGRKKKDDEMRAILENEIAQQSSDDEDDQDLTSKL